MLYRQMAPLVVALVLGFLTAAAAAAPLAPDEAGTATPTVAVQRVSLSLPVVREEAAMVLVGTALIGLAAALRRAAS